jgi:chromosome segregation ATPase
MKNKLAMFMGAYVFTTVTAAVYAYQKFSEKQRKCAGLKHQLDNEININSQLDETMAELERDLKNKTSKRVNALQDQLTVNKENWQHLFKGYEEQRDRAVKLDKQVDQLTGIVSKQNLVKMEMLVKMDEKDSEILKLKSEVGRLLENNENLERDLGDAQLALQSNDAELKSLRARLADYECPDELAIKL